jgi:hypothetical protein
MTHLFYHCVPLWHWKESKTITMPKPVMGLTLPQNWRFISFLFTKATLLVKYILRIFQTHSGKLKVPPISRLVLMYVTSWKLRITWHKISSKLSLWVLYSRILENSLKPNGTLAFRKVVKINILITISMLLNSLPSCKKFKLSIKCEIHMSTILCNLATGSVII